MAQYAYLTATAQVKIGAAKLKGILVNSGTNPTVAVYNSAAAATTDIVLDTMTFATVPASFLTSGDDTGVYLDEGLYVVLGGTSPKVTIVYE